MQILSVVALCFALFFTLNYIFQLASVAALVIASKATKASSSTLLLWLTAISWSLFYWCNL